MKNVNVCLLAAMVCTYSIQANADYLNKTPNFILNDKLMTLEAKPLPIPNQAVKLAAVCAVTSVECVNAGSDNNNNIDMNLDQNKQCEGSKCVNVTVDPCAGKPTSCSAGFERTYNDPVAYCTNQGKTYIISDSSICGGGVYVKCSK